MFFIIWTIVAPFSTLIPSLKQTLETFVAVFIALIVVGELTSGTIYGQLFGIARALFVVFYLMLSLNDGIFKATFQNIDLMVDFRFFLVFSMLFGLLGLARSVFQAINYVNERVEYARV